MKAYCYTEGYIHSPPRLAARYWFHTTTDTRLHKHSIYHTQSANVAMSTDPFVIKKNINKYFQK